MNLVRWSSHESGDLSASGACVGTPRRSQAAERYNLSSCLSCGCPRASSQEHMPGTAYLGGNLVKSLKHLIWFLICGGEAAIPHELPNYQTPPQPRHHFRCFYPQSNCFGDYPQLAIGEGRDVDQALNRQRCLYHCRRAQHEH